jgi:hypothetical protein
MQLRSFFVSSLGVLIPVCSRIVEAKGVSSFADREFRRDPWGITTNRS